ncbi:MAG: signal peptidase I [Pyrinomonadaceae bacterium]
MSKEKKLEEPKIKSVVVNPPKNVWLENFESLIVTLIMAIFGMTFIIQAVTVPTGSMQNTILIGDYLLVNKFIFNAGGNPLWFLPQREIRRGDIIVFKYPGNRVNPESDDANNLEPYKINYVKRVIGLPGEMVEFRDDRVFINGRLLAENRMIGDAPEPGSALKTEQFEPKNPEATYTVVYSKGSIDFINEGNHISTERMNFGVIGKPMIVPEDSFFVMGDSRDNSEDSRYWGFVPRSVIIGRAMFVYWSCDRSASNGSMLSCLTNPRLSRIGTMIK